MDIRIHPSELKGTVSIPSSKSCAHRALICASLARGSSVISGISMSDDIQATISAMTALGASFETTQDGKIIVSGISDSIPEKAVLDCNESGSTLRFIIPVAAALGVDAEFYGRGRLPERPINIYTRELSKNGIAFDYNNTMPFSITGKLTSGTYTMEGNVSSQFITGLLFALPLLDGDSVIRLTSRLESKPYVDITIDCLKKFGVRIKETENGYSVPGNQRFMPNNMTVEGDYSQAAFFYTANALGCDIKLQNLDKNSVQGDKKILEIISEMCYNDSADRMGHFETDCSDIPDLVPILAVLGCFGSGTSVIYNAERLKIKESNRLEAISVTLNNLGGNVTVTDDGLIIQPVETLHGGEVDSFGDHRIVMAAAVAAVRADGDVTIRGAEAVAKSYPDFFRDYNKIGGNANVITLE